MISYKDPGKYVAVCIRVDWKSHYVKVFDFPKPEVRESPDLGGFACPPGIDASWYYLNRVDSFGCVEAVYPVSIFAKETSCTCTWDSRSLGPFSP